MSSLSHHGVKGQKWGIRRYQNYDGTRIRQPGDYTTRISNKVDRNNFKALDKYKSVIVGEIHSNSMVDYYDKLLAHRKPEYFICEFADEDRALDRKTLKERMDNATDGATEGTGADYQYNYWAYELAYKHGCKLIGCNPVFDRRRATTMNKEDAIRERYMLEVLKEFQNENFVAQIGDHHLRSIPITKEFADYCGDTTDDRGIVNDITVSNSSPIWETFKDSNQIAICREESEWKNEDDFTNRKDISHSSLSHHGVDGQQWGLRRYQYEDGTLTPLGREHYGYGDEEFQRRRTEAAKSRKEVLKNMDLFTTDELQELSARFNAEDQLKRENIEKGLQVMSDLAQVANNVYVIGSALGYFGAAEHSSLGGTMYDRQLEHSSMTGDGMLIVDGTLYLEHHGVKGQKHGVRQYQNYDGSLTPLGRIHYGYGQARSKAGPVVTNALKKTGQAAGIVTNAFKEARQAAAAASEERREHKLEKKKEKASKDRSSVLRNRNLFTTKELEDLEKRFTAEDKLRANIPDKKALRKAAADQKAAEKLAERKEKASQTREGVLRNKKLFTNEELKALSERFNTEDKIKQESIDKGLAVVKNMANAAQSVQTIVSVFEDVSGYNISPIKRAQAEQKKVWDLEDRQRKQHFEDTKEAREEGKYKREEASAAAKDKRDIETWERDKQRADAKEQREIEQVEYNRKRDRVKDQRERAERLIKKRQDAEDRKRKLAREDAEDRRKAAEEIRKIKKEAAEERRKAITGKNLAKKQKAEARLAEIKAIEAAMGLSNNKDLTDFEEWLRTIDPTWTRHDSFDSDYVIQNGVLLVNPQGSSLAHHGIKNQRWGVRRYQNYDGSLTPAGRERYGVGPEAGYNASINEDAIRASGHKYYDNKYPEKGHNPKDSEEAADKRRAEIAKELRKMGFKISENMTAEEHAAATAKILEKPYTEKKPLTAEDFRQIPDRFKVEAMTEDESTLRDIEDYRAHAKELLAKAKKMEDSNAPFSKSLINKAMIEKLRKEAADDEWFAGELEATQLSKKGKAELAKRRKEESDREEAEFKKMEWMDAHEGTPKEETVRDGTPPFSDSVKKRRIEVAKKEDSYDLDFLETIQNDWYLGNDSPGAKRERLKEYEKYLDDPENYHHNHHADEDPPSFPKQRNVWDAASKITTTPETETKMSYTRDEQRQRLADAKKNGQYDITFAEATVYWGDDKGSKANLDQEYARYLTNPRKYLEDQANQNKETQRRIMAARVRQMSGTYTAEEIAKKLGVSESTVRTMQGANPTFLAERGLSRPRKYQNPDGTLTEAGKKKFEEGKVMRTLNIPSDYRQQPGYKKKAKHSSMESNYIIQNGVLMINPAERR